MPQRDDARAQSPPREAILTMEKILERPPAAPMRRRPPYEEGWSMEEQKKRDYILPQNVLAPRALDYTIFHNADNDDDDWCRIRPLWKFGRRRRFAFDDYFDEEQLHHDTQVLNSSTASLVSLDSFEHVNDDQQEEADNKKEQDHLLPKITMSDGHFSSPLAMSQSSSSTTPRASSRGSLGDRSSPTQR